MNTGSAPLLRLSDVVMEFGTLTKVRALRGCSLAVDRGEFLAVVGPSGSGKSTLLSVMGLLVAPTHGSVFLDGVDMLEASDKSRTHARARQIGFIFQSSHLVMFKSVVENVELGLAYAGLSSRKHRTLAEEMLESLGMAHRLHAMPSTLSGGEAQRVAIARAMVKSPQLLLCDEPTGSLDSENAASVLSALSTLSDDGRALVIITHDADVAAFARRIVTIRDGVIAIDQTHGVTQP